MKAESTHFCEGLLLLRFCGHVSGAHANLGHFSLKLNYYLFHCTRLATNCSAFKIFTCQ